MARHREPTANFNRASQNPQSNTALPTNATGTTGERIENVQQTMQIAKQSAQLSRAFEDEQNVFTKSDQKPFLATMLDKVDAKGCMNYAAKSNNSAIRAAAKEALSHCPSEYDLNPLLSLIVKDLVDTFSHQKDNIKSAFKENFLETISNLHKEINLDYLSKWLDCCLGEHNNDYDLSFNNGNSDFDEPNFDHAALTAHLSWNNIYTIDLPEHLTNTLLYDAINTIGASIGYDSQATQITYFTGTQEFVEALGTTTLKTENDLKKHQDTLLRVMNENLGMDEDEDTVIERFIEDFWESVNFIQNHYKTRTKGKKTAAFFLGLMKETHLETYLATGVTNTLITDYELFENQLYAQHLFTGDESHDNYFKIKVHTAIEQMEAMYNNFLVLNAINAYCIYQADEKELSEEMAKLRRAIKQSTKLEVK
ncbi:hypothetical protein ACP3V3_01700 [Vibrio sp. PNB22_3_1]